MKYKNILCVLGIAVCGTLQAQGIVQKTFHVAKPGTLVEQLTEEEANQITHLTLQGKINAIDFRHLRDEFKNLQQLDISTVSIAMYTGKNGTHKGFYVYPANCIPAYAFCTKVNDSTFVGKNTLRRVILSDKTRNIEDAAFKGCDNLRVCQIRKKSAPNLLPEALADSVSAIFVPQGSVDAFRNAKRWEDFAFIEGEPVSVTVQIGMMDSLESELLRLGVQPKAVNFLRIEGKTDEADYKLMRDYMPFLVQVDLTESNSIQIPAYTFTQKKYLLNVSLPKGLKTVGERAFSGCIRLSGELRLPASVTALEFGAFMGCDKLHRVVVMGNQLTTVGDKLFGETPVATRLIRE